MRRYGCVRGGRHDERYEDGRRRWCVIRQSGDQGPSSYYNHLIELEADEDAQV